MDRLRLLKRIAALAGVVLVCGSMALAKMDGNPGGMGQNPGQQPNPPSSMPMNGMQMSDIQNSDQPSIMDRLFAQTAMEGGIAEIDMGKLVLAKSTNDQVKQFAQRMIDDHTKLNDQMAPIARQIGASVPTEASKKDRTMAAKLQALSGTQFDQAYIREMVKAHKQALGAFQQEASSGQNHAIENAAAQGSKIVAGHLQLAEQMAKDQNVAMSR